jgi:cell division protein FtsL
VITLRAAQRERHESELDQSRRPALRVVDDLAAPPRRRTPAGVVGTMLVTLLFVCIFGIVVFQVFLVQTQSHLDDLSQKISAQEATQKELRLDTADLEAPSRIEKDALQRLGMIPPNDIGYLQAKPDDDAKAAFDPTKEKAPTTTVPPATSAAPAAGAKSASGTGTATTAKPTTTKPGTKPAASSSATTTPTTTAPKTAGKTTSTTAAPAKTPTTGTR